MTPIPEFVLEMREMIGHHPLWLPGITAVITRGDGHVLLVRRSDNGAWTPVTGIVDPGEEPAVAAAREAREETGVVIRVDRLAAASVLPEMAYDNGDRAAYLDLTFACTWLSGEAHVADDESTDVRWWPVEDLPPMSEHMRSRLDAGLADEREARFVTDATRPPLGTDVPAADPAGGTADTTPPPLAPDGPVLGVSGCESGWVGVLLGPEGRPRVHVAASLADLVGLVRETTEPAVVAIAGGRDRPGRTDEVAGFVRFAAAVHVVEVAGDVPVDARPASRRAALLAGGLSAPAWFRGSGFTEHDLLDACDAVLDAVRRGRVGAPAPPTLDPC